MAASQRPRPLFLLLLSICVSFTSLLSFNSQALRDGRRDDRLNSTEFPAEHIDPAAIDLTPLVNTLINTSQSVRCSSSCISCCLSGSRQLFSLLSVTSYSSLALHRLTLLVYNISSIRSVDTHTLRKRFCYCVNNDTNDLTDFAAILLDVMGNSTSYLHELFKSASILSVSQRNNSDCIYICVMAGKRGGDMSELWPLDSITPLFNQTIVEGPRSGGNVSSVRTPPAWQPPSNRSPVSVSGPSSVLSGRVHSTAHVSITTVEDSAGTPGHVTAARPLVAPAAAAVTPQTPPTPERGQTSAAAAQLVASTQTRTTLPRRTAAATAPPPDDSLSPGASDGSRPGTEILHTADTVPTAVSTATTESTRRRTTTPSSPVETPGCPWRLPQLAGGVSAPGGGGVTMVSAQKLQPCVLELCRFFSQCLCRASRHKMNMKRYCDDSHLWYKKHTAEVCRRMRRVSVSRNLKQRCLTKMCDKL